MTSKLSRRRFIGSSAAALCISESSLASSFGALPNNSSGLQEQSLDDRIFKTLKVDMIEVDGDLTEKFKAAKSAGFIGVEMNSPGMDVEETKKAITNSGIVVDGTVGSTHWDIRHTDPKKEVRTKALNLLEQAIRDTHAVGGNSVLLVPGHGKDGTEKEIWNRSISNIRAVLPLCARYGVHLLIENVWNHFLYDHSGDHNQTAKKFVQYCDEFESPWVGMQFDIGNHRKYGNMGDWIRNLGKRVVKLDLKGYHRANDDWTNIGEGDIDWANVCGALNEVNFYGWAAAEIKGGNLERLKEISANMDKVLKLSVTE